MKVLQMRRICDKIAHVVNCIFKIYIIYTKINSACLQKTYLGESMLIVFRK